MKPFKDVCNYLIFVCLENEIEINTIKLSKFVYLCNILSFVLNGERLTVEPVVRLKHSPGVKQVLDYYSVTEVLKHNPDFKTVSSFSKIFTEMEMKLMDQVVFEYMNHSAFQLTELLIDSLGDPDYHERVTYSLIEIEFIERAAKTIFPAQWAESRLEEVEIACYREKNVSALCTHIKAINSYKLELSKNGKVAISTSFKKEEDAIESFRSAVCNFTAELSVNATLDKMEGAFKSKKSFFQQISLR